MKGALVVPGNTSPINNDCFALAIYLQLDGTLRLWMSEEPVITHLLITDAYSSHSNAPISQFAIPSLSPSNGLALPR